MGIRYKKFSQEKSHSWELCKNVNLVFPILVIYNNINLFLKNVLCGDNSIWWLVGSESGRSSRTAWQCNSNPGNNFLSENNQNGS